MVKFLVNIKDLKKIKNNFGFTPKDLAKSIGDDKIQELFRSPLKRGIKETKKILRLSK